MTDLIKNRTYVMDVVDIGSEGEGIAKQDGFVVLVPGALPGESIEARIIKITSGYAVGKLEKVIIPSPERVEPACPVYSRCGGCSLQHLAYSAQLHYKTKRVKDSIERIGGLNITVHECVPGEPERYRNKAQYPVGGTEGAVSIGFYAPRSHRIAEVSDCRIQHPANEKIIIALRRFMQDNKITPYDEWTGKGLVRHLVTRVSTLTGELMVILVINGQSLPNAEALTAELRKVQGVASIILNINTRKTNTILGDRCVTLWGKDTLTDRVCGIDVSVSPLSFVQVNPVQAEKLYQLAVDAAQLCPTETVADAYCGTGVLTQLLARKAKKAFGIENVPQAIEDARRSAQDNGTGNVEFILGDCAEQLPLLTKRTHCDVIVLDPPRKGCDRAVLDAVITAQPERAVYISCNPATLARDLKILAEGGLVAKEAWPVDMFPQTGHVETVVLMSRVKE